METTQRSNFQKPSDWTGCVPLEWLNVAFSAEHAASPGFSGRNNLDFDWCSIVRVDSTELPCTVQFCRAQHTLIVFDHGSYLYGERAINGTRMSGAGPLDGGIDVVPASAKFVGLAGAGSKVGCTFISIDPSRYDDEDGDGGKKAQWLWPAVGLKGTLIGPLSGRLRQISNSASGDWNRLYIEGAVTMLFGEILAMSRQTAGTRSRASYGALTSKAQRTVHEYLLNNLDAKVDLQTLASQVGLSRFHFSRAFKQSFGMPPYRYLMELRIKKAADLLRRTDQPIIDVGLDVGFAGAAEFSRAFRQFMNCTPRRFRISAA